MNIKISLAIFLCYFLIGIDAESVKILNSTITWINRGDSSDFKIEMPLKNTNDYWLGIGLNKNPKMVIFSSIFNKIRIEKIMHVKQIEWSHCSNL
jgi:hypothetical protein